MGRKTAKTGKARKHKAFARQVTETQKRVSREWVEALREVNAPDDIVERAEQRAERSRKAGTAS